MHQKRIILMYISEVSGHHCATIAVEKAIKMLAPGCEVLNINAFNYTNPISEKIVNKIYMSVIKAAPGIWDYLYDNQSVARGIEKLKKRVHKFNSPKMKALIDSFKPDAILCSQAYPCGMVADYKKAFGSRIPLVAVLTDYVPHSYWLYDTVDFYVTPSDEVSCRLEKKGVEARRIKPLGIPFNPEFNRHIDRQEVFAGLKLNPDKPVILIMGGGQGLGPIKTIVKSLEGSHYPLQEIIVAGTNKRLYQSLKKKIKKYKKRILLYGYADNVNELMSISDVIISKPGGVTTAEALSKKLPMVIVKPIPGQEANNTAYLTKQGAAVKLLQPKEITRVIDGLLDDHHKLKQLKDACGRIAKPHASVDIAKLLLNLAHG
jgi:processive 1,2-diacylglycerol beta-glucosyltransferase